MHTALLALLLAQLALPGQAAPGGLVYPLGADLAQPGSVYQLGPVGTPSLSWTPAVGVYTSPITPTVGPALTFARASTGTYQTSATAIASAASGELRCGYTGCLTEPARTNALTQSAALDTWTKAASGASAITVTANAAQAPDGTSTADQLAFPAVTAGQYSIIGQTGFTVSASGNTFSVWGQAASGTVAAYLYAYDTTAGSYLGNTLCTWTTTWSRCALTVTGTAGHSANAWIGCDRSSGSGMSNTSAGTAYLWGGQFEAGPWASSLIPTTTTATARAADVLSVPSSVLGSGAASLHLVLTPEWASSVDATLVQSTTANELVLATVSGALDWLVGGNDITTSALGWSAGTAQTLDAWYTPGGVYRVTDGTHSASGSSASTPSPGTPLYLGGTSSAGAGVAISQVKVCKRAGMCR